MQNIKPCRPEDVLQEPLRGPHDLNTADISVFFSKAASQLLRRSSFITRIKKTFGIPVLHFPDAEGPFVSLQQLIEMVRRYADRGDRDRADRDYTDERDDHFFHGTDSFAMMFDRRRSGATFPGIFTGCQILSGRCLWTSPAHL